MEENNVIGLETLQDKDQVQIADDVIAIISEIATLEVEGIVGMGSYKTDIVQAMGFKKTAKGIKVEVTEGEVFIDVTTVIEYGKKIQEVCLEVQKKVKNAVETMTGLQVVSVNVFVVDVYFNKTKEA